MDKNQVTFIWQRIGFLSTALAFPALVLGTCINIKTANSINAQRDYVRPPVVFVYEDGSTEVWEQGKTKGTERQLKAFVTQESRKIASALYGNPQDPAVVSAKASEVVKNFSPKSLAKFKNASKEAGAISIKTATQWVIGSERIQYLPSHKAWVYIVNGTRVDSAKDGNFSAQVTMKLSWQEVSDEDLKANPSQILHITEEQFDVEKSN